MRWGRAAAIATCLAAGVAGAAAQTLPWPGEKPEGGAAPWPGDKPGAAAPAAPAAPAMAAPAAPPPMMGGPSMAPQQQQMPPCLAEFTRLRGEVEKHGAVAKAINDRHGSREDLCKAITTMVAAEGKWVSYSEKNRANCGIPPNIIKQIKTNHEHMLTVRKRVCDTGATAAGAPPAPSLSEALGTSQLPARDNTTTKRGGTLDTLTGNPIR